MNIDYYILSALAALIALTVHEYSHGYVAYKLGDPTARNLGRLTLNPIKHIDPIGALCMVFFHVGWAKPVPINARNFDNPRRGFALTALAGPMSNIILAFFSGGLYLLVYSLLRDVQFAEQNLLFNMAYYTLSFIFIFHSVNIGLGIFNLLPIPPFDGSRILNVILPERLYFGIMKYERKIYLGVLAWLLVGDWVAAGLRMIPLVAATPWLNWLVGVFSLSGMLRTAIGGISDLIFSFWQLIPGLAL